MYIFNYRRREEGAFEEVRNRGGSRSFNTSESQVQVPKLSLGNKYGALSQDQSWKHRSNQNTSHQYCIVALFCFVTQPRRENIFSRLGSRIPSVYHSAHVHILRSFYKTRVCQFWFSSAILKWSCDGSSILGICTCAHGPCGRACAQAYFHTV